MVQMYGSMNTRNLDLFFSLWICHLPLSLIIFPQFDRRKQFSSNKFQFASNCYLLETSIWTLCNSLFRIFVPDKICKAGDKHLVKERKWYTANLNKMEHNAAMDLFSHTSFYLIMSILPISPCYNINLSRIIIKTFEMWHIHILQVQFS